MAKMPDGWIITPRVENGVTVVLEKTELVKCKNCRHSAILYSDNDPIDGYCQRHNIAVTEEFFCADGKKKEEKQ